MSDEEKTGEKDAVDVVYSRVMAENEALKDENGKLKSALDSMRKELQRANELIESEARSKIIEELRRMGCTYGVEELDRMSLDRLQGLVEDYKYFNPPFKSAGDFAKPVRKNIYDSLYDKYVPVEQRIRELRER